MRAKRIMANLRVADVDAAKGFYTDFLGLTTEDFNMGGSPATPRPRPARGSSWSRATPPHRPIR
jgi:catechol 2,3-dioxygenase-like lactoylglutathione lyase family enzyme